MSAEYFAFAQFDLVSGYGLTPARYPVRPEGEPGGAPEDVLIFATVDALIGRPRRRRGRTRPRDVASGDVATVQVQRATIVRAGSFADEAEAKAWLTRTRDDEAELEAMLERALMVLNRALHAHRSAAQDPYVPDVSAERALAVRVGYGTGDAVASGEWSEAVEVPTQPARVRRSETLRPQERVARVLGGHETVGVCEALLLRARADLDGGRLREAALELRSGVAALLVELEGTGGPDQAADLAELEARREELAAAAKAALRSVPAEDIAGILAIAERVIRRRRILGG